MEQLKAEERPLIFRSGGHELLGILHLPPRPRRVGLIMLPAAQQYRVGPHRQHVLIARGLATRGFASFRYDPSGMGDSSGPYRDFDMAPDMDGAVDALLASAPDVKEVVLWGVCGSASAILMHKERKTSVRGMILVNPWVHSERAQARTYLKHYYRFRIFEAEFWRKFLAGRLDTRAALSSLSRVVQSAFGSGSTSTPAREQTTSALGPGDAGDLLEERMADGLESFGGRVLLIMSGNDLTAREFDEFTQSSERWRPLLGVDVLQRRDLPEADHIFSEPQWREQVVDWMADWMGMLERDGKTP